MSNLEVRELVTIYRYVRDVKGMLTKKYPADWYERNGGVWLSLVFCSAVVCLTMSLFMMEDIVSTGLVTVVFGALAAFFAGSVGLMSFLAMRYRRFPHVPRWAHPSTPLTPEQLAFLDRFEKTQFAKRREDLIEIARENDARSFFFIYMAIVMFIEKHMTQEEA